MQRVQEDHTRSSSHGTVCTENNASVITLSDCDDTRTLCYPGCLPSSASLGNRCRSLRIILSQGYSISQIHYDTPALNMISFGIIQHILSQRFLPFYHNLSGSIFCARNRHWNTPSTTARRASVLFANCFQACRNYIHGFNGNILPEYSEA